MRLALPQAYHERRTSSLPVGKHTAALAEELNRKLQGMWSPEQIAEKHRAEGKPFVCFKTIYRWLYEGRLAAGEVKVHDIRDPYVDTLKVFRENKVLDYENNVVN